jgi:hypothetical protein
MGDIRLGYRTVDNMGCPWSTARAIQNVEQVIKRIPNYDQPSSYLLTQQQAEYLLGGTLPMTGKPDGRSIMTSSGNELWVRASYGDMDAFDQVATSLCDFGEYNASNKEDFRMCGNQTLALLDAFYFSNHSWANHSVTRHSFLQDIVYTKKEKAAGIHCALLYGPGILTGGADLLRQSGGDCNIAFPAFMSPIEGEMLGTFGEYYKDMLRNGDLNTLSPNIVSLLFSKGHEVSLLDITNSTRWYSAIRYCESIENNWETDCTGMYNYTKMAAENLPQIFAYEEGYENDFLAASTGKFREHFVGQVCSVARYLRYHIENSSFVGDTVATLLDDRLSYLGLDMQTHENLKQLGYAQFGNGLVTQALFDGAKSIAHVNTSEADEPIELPLMAAKFGWTNASLSWEAAETVLSQLSSNWGGHGLVESDALLGSVLNSVLLNHTFNTFGDLRFPVVDNVTAGLGLPVVNNVTAPTEAPTKSPDPWDAYDSISLLTSQWIPRDCTALPSACVLTNTFGAAHQINTTRGQILTAYALDFARRAYFIDSRLWCVEPDNCDYTKGGMFKQMRVKNFLFEGYNDPFHVVQTMKATQKEAPGALFECQTTKFFTELDVGLIGAEEYQIRTDRIMTNEDGVELPFGYFYWKDKRCQRKTDKECGQDGFKITLPPSLFTSMSSAEYAANPGDSDPFYYDRERTKINGYHNVFTGLYPFKYEMYAPELTFPREMITSGGFGYREAKVPNPIRGLFLSKTVDDIIWVRATACDKISNYWGSCSIGIDSGNTDLSKLGRVISMYGNMTNTFYAVPPTHPWATDKGGMDLNNTLFGWTLAPNLWNGFALPPPPEEIKIFVEELVLPFKVPHKEQIYYAYTPDIPATTKITDEKLKELRADKPGVRFAEIALEVYCFTGDSWDFTRAATNESSAPARTIQLRGVGYGRNSNYYLSPPHYMYNEDSDGLAQERTKYTGLVPNERIHRTCFKYDPLTGEAFSHEKRYQLNYRVVKSVIYPTLSREEFYWPVIWHERGHVRYPEEGFEFHSSLLMFMGLQRLVQGIGAGFGVLMVMVGTLTWRIAAAEQRRRIAIKQSAFEISKRM